MFEMGHVFACLGAALAALLPGIGSAKGVSSAGQTVAGLTAEQPKSFFKGFILQILPATQGIYGFVVAFMIISKIGLGGTLVSIGTEQGLTLLIAGIPIAVVGLFSAIYQSKMASASINLLGKQPDSFGRGMMMTGVVETYALLAFVISIFLIG